MKTISWSFLTLIAPYSISWIHPQHPKLSFKRLDQLCNSNKPDPQKPIINREKKSRSQSSSTQKDKDKISPHRHQQTTRTRIITQKSLKRISSLEKDIQTWRIFEVSVHPDDLFQSQQETEEEKEEEEEKDTIQKIVKNSNEKNSIDKMYLYSAVMDSLIKRFKGSLTIVEPYPFVDVRVVRRSLDARKTRRGGSTNTDIVGPRYVYVLDVDLTSNMVQQLKLKEVSGRMERIQDYNYAKDQSTYTTNHLKYKKDLNHTIIDSSSSQHYVPTVIVIGAGPAGLFCALTLAQTKKVHVIVLERGQAVESRGKSIGALIHRRFLDTESNFAFGEGGAGTWSDGKLTTRIGRNSESVRRVLETLVSFGAPSKILIDGAPHLGTDNLVRLLRNMRNELRQLGAEVRFGARMTDLCIDEESRRVQGVEVQYGKSMERGLTGGRTMEHEENEGKIERIHADRVVIATGHSARDVYEILHSSGVQLEPKGFAVGFRVEHPQKVINKIQYGEEWGASAYSGKVSTDVLNREYFNSLEHKGRLPVSSYRLATDKAFDGEEKRGVFSFCQCPGGQIVISSTNPDEICINGMSFSKRDSLWANSALVVTIDADDSILQTYRDTHGVLAGLAFQRDMERRAAEMGGGNLVVPVQRLTDFINERPSTSAPSSSYRLGVKPSPCHEIYPQKINQALKDAIINYFNKQMPGFLCDDALLHAVETRTSSPLRVSRDSHTKQALGVKGLFPSGEGAGFAGGIVSASVDGINVAYSVLDSLDLTPSEDEIIGFDRNIGFDY